MDIGLMSPSLLGSVLWPIVLVVGVGLNYALQHFCLNQLIEQCYLFFKGASPFLRANLYYLLISMPVVLYVLVSMIVLPNSTGVQLCLETDCFNILIIFGYIVYVEESKQTTLEGFLLSRDIIMYLGSVFLLGYYILNPAVDGFWWAIHLVWFILFWIVNCLNSSIHYKILKLLGLLNDERVVSSDLLITQQHAKMDINELQDIITENTQLIKNEANKFNKLLDRAVANQKHRKIHRNFASIVLALKMGIEIKKEAETTQRAYIYQRFWLPKQNEKFNQQYNIVSKIEEEQDRSPRNCSFPDTDEKIEIGTEPTPPQNMCFKILKVLYFPVFLLSLATGRLKYLSYLTALILLCVNVFGMHYAVLYLGQGVLSSNVIMALIGFTLAIPNLTYFTKLRGNNDYDFCNIFIQTGIFKMTVVVGLGLLLNSLLAPASTFQSTKLIPYLIAKLSCIVGFCGVMCLKKGVARRQNFKYLLIVYILSYGGTLTALMV